MAEKMIWYSQQLHYQLELAVNTALPYIWFHVLKRISMKTWHSQMVKARPSKFNMISISARYQCSLTELRTHLHNHRNSRVWSLICTALFYLKKQDKHLNCIWGSTQAILILISRSSVLTSIHRPKCLDELYLVLTISYRNFIFQ